MQLPQSLNRRLLETAPKRRPRSTKHRSLTETVYPSFAGKAFLGVARVRVAMWDRALRRLRETQEKQLRRILTTARDSEFGRRYDFGSIKNWQDYRARVPLGDYDSFAPDFQRMRKGEPNVLTQNRVRYICESAGSSSKGQRKFLPVSDMQVEFQAGSGVDCVYRYLANRGDDTFLRGFIMSVFPPSVLRREGTVEITNNPALMMTKLPLPSQLVYLPDRETASIDDIDRKLDVIARKYLDHDVRTVTGTTCWFPILFEKVLEAARREGRNVSTVAEIWPNLRFMVGGGVIADPYLPALRERLGRDDFDLVDNYNATEGGIFAATDHASGDRGMLMIPDRGVFYEFVPIEELDATNPTRLAAWEVETGRDYVIHTSTVSGLYSYRLGDIVRFSRLWPHHMEYVGRLSGCLSVTQELTTHIEVQRAMEAAVNAVPAAMVDYTVGSEIDPETGKGRYIIFAEFAPGREPADAAGFLSAFDAAHIEQNRAYRQHRFEETAILEPHLVALPEGSMRRFMKDCGFDSLQTKFPRIVDDERRDRLLSYAAEAQ